MAELYDLDRTDGDNTDPDKLGWPEDMPRSEVNNRARELSGALSRWYHDAEWVRRLEEQAGTTFTVTYLSDTQVRISGGDASAFFSVGDKIRVSNAGASAAAGYVSAIVAGPPTDVTIDFPTQGVLDENPASTWSGFGTSGNDTPATSLGNTPVAAGSVKIEDTSTHIKATAVTDDGAGLLTHPDDGNVGTINYVTGAVAVNNLAVDFDSNVNIDYQYTGKVPSPCTLVEHFISRSVQESAFRDVGTGVDEVPSNFDLGTAAYKEEGEGGGLDADTVDGKHSADIVSDVNLAGRNFLINPSFRVFQRGTTIDATTAFDNSNDSYVADRWYLLSDGNDRVDITQSTDVPTSPQITHNSIQLEVETVTGSPNSEQFGIVQIVEGCDTSTMIGRAVSFSFWAKSSGTLEFIRAAVLSWTGTMDSITTSDILASPGSWSTGALTGRTHGSWTVEGETAQLTVSGTWTEFKLEDVDIDAGSAANVAVFIWVDETDFATNDTLLITGCQLEIGDMSSSFRDRSAAEELAMCRRFFLKTFDAGVTPAQGINDTAGALIAITDLLGGTTDGAQWQLPVEMFSAPAVVTYNPTATVDADWSDGTTAVVDTNRKKVIEVSGAGVATGDTIHVTAEAEL